MDIGDRLKEARKASGLTLEAVEERTKIRRKYIKALEEERFEVLPGPIYAKAFLKNYAKFLQLDPNEILEIYNQQFAVEQIQGVAKTSSEKEFEPGIAGRPRYWLYLVAAVIILGLAVSVYYGVMKTMSHQVNQNKELAQPPLSSDEQPQKPEDQLPAVEQEPPAQNHGINLVLEVKTSKCWIGAEIDGSPAFQGMLSAGQSKSFTADEEIYVTLGNAGVVEVVYNGENLGFLGRSGEVITRKFPDRSPE
ncbi:MAG: hypothetical protein XD97_0119 [Pelotomaculum thermopropionicum]|uniref:HTH cro/C1-type domain-containing protein n=1 Tax=Pelotomaculum thermopropionicum TaxID=110500 RepID=A0A117M4E3_9FIRM|nr:MAG: hypothetical protein XD97_0119 [Pelotomaculum thermopropionicum]